ncbi:LytR/AlgR family response regulator transcription factor [Neptunicella sp. SCSIO 80796]|uniref:LytR/AlgR family response regulator transcription factor n=1 Tax=Neptunicella plasticusilytica TaxID=3117012 RepID=UPI003A4E1A76
MLNALIIDDEPLAHEVILHHLAQHEDIKVAGRCYNATEALAWLANHQADLMFLDINMPALNGIELLKVLANRPQVLIVSAYQEYALQGFELDVTDYLLKPVSGERLAMALDKVRQRARSMLADSVTHEEPRCIVLKVDGGKRKWLLNDISLLEAYGNYVKLWQGGKMTLVSSSLKQLKASLPAAQFTQVHKSYVVNNSQVAAINTDTLTLEDGRTVKMGKLFKHQAQQLLG